MEQNNEPLPFTDEPDVYTCDEVAKLWRVDIETIWYYIRSGELKAFRVGREYRIMREDVEEFKARKSNQTNS